jgi:hypothetical protein
VLRAGFPANCRCRMKADDGQTTSHNGSCGRQQGHKASLVYGGRSRLRTSIARGTKAHHRCVSSSQRKGQGRVEYRAGASERAVRKALPILNRILDQWHQANLPKPPRRNAGLVWYYRRQKRIPLESLIAGDSEEGQDCLRGTTIGSRKQEAIRHMKAVETFRRQAPAWFFDYVSTLWALKANLP